MGIGLNLKMKMMLWALSVMVGGVFIYAAWEKEFLPQLFADGIASFGILPDRLIMPAALAIPPFEMVAGALALSGWHRRIGLLALVFATTTYCIAIASALVRHVPLNCGCFDAASSLSPPSELVRDVFPLLLCILACLLAGGAIARRKLES